MTTIVAGIEYTLPQVYLLNETGLGVAEFGARTCYNSFDNSENKAIRRLNIEPELSNDDILEVNDIEHSNLLDDLSWTYFHYSILEHAVLQYNIRGMSRGVLQELARHRMVSPSVQSTRYTMGGIINAFIAHLPSREACSNVEEFSIFLDKNIDYLVTAGEYNGIEHSMIYHKLMHQYNLLGREEFLNTFTSKDMRTNGALEQSTPENIFKALEVSKQKRNVGDAAKHIVTDNWKVDAVVTINLRSLKNFLTLRDSGAAYFLMRETAKQIKNATPQKYLNLIIKDS